MRMKTKHLFFAALALTALASCAEDSFTGDPSTKENGNGAISFNSGTPALTRASKSGSDAATDLNNEFIVWGEKNESSGSAATAANLVFENYKVAYTTNTAYTTTSNTKNWEYVGFAPYAANVTPVIAVDNQTIKYWDYNATSYTFTAVSAKPADITDGKVVITKITSGSTVYDKGYDISIKADASVDDIFVSDRNQPTKNTNTDRDATNQYGGNVTMTFRNFMSKIRFGIYENIPGYKVKITDVDYNSTNSTTTKKFGVDGKFIVPGANTAYTITYYSSNNKAKAAIKAETTPNTVAYLETTTGSETLADCPILHTTPTEISTSPATPTYNRTGGTYTTILPFPSNDGNMKVKMDFTLTSEDTGETIEVVDATAEIPAAYCQWLPNYAYTYILKLNDNTNGQIGGVTGLYPITFDAVEITDENGKAEYITTVSEPSITTFGVKGGVYSTEQSDYAASTDVYATVVDGGSVVALTKSSNIWLYTVTGTGITEAAVAERLIEAPTMNASQITTANAKTNPTDVTTASLTIQNTAPREDNVSENKTIGDNKVAKFTTATGTKYALVYQKTAATYICGTAVTTTDASDYSTKATAAPGGKLYTTAQCTTEGTAGAGTFYAANGKTYDDASAFAAAGLLYTNPACTTVAESFENASTVYYKPIKVDNKGVYTVKVVTCP